VISAPTRYQLDHGGAQILHNKCTEQDEKLKAVRSLDYAQTKQTILVGENVA